MRTLLEQKDSSALAHKDLKQQITTEGFEASGGSMGEHVDEGKINQGNVICQITLIKKPFHSHKAYSPNKTRSSQPHAKQTNQCTTRKLFVCFLWIYKTNLVKAEAERDAE